MPGLFVTSTGTGIGKTFLTEQLLRFDEAHQRCFSASKPIITGWPQDVGLIPETDTGRLLAAQSLPCDMKTLDDFSPWRYSLPLTPSRAARLEKRAIDIEALLSHCQEYLVQAKQQRRLHLFEGVGGVMAPLKGDFTVLDWIEALGCPTLMIVGSYLGTLSHTLTALEVLASRKCSVLGVIITGSPGSDLPLVETFESLQEILPTIPLFLFPRTPQEQIFSLKSLYTILLQYLLSHTMAAHQLTI